MSAGPLAGLRVIELTGQGPGPYGASLLADFGCDVVCIDRAAADPAVAAEPSSNPLMRGKRSIVVDLKQDGAAGRVVELVGAADVFIDPFRPGVCERLGLGPEVLCAINPRLIYVRITGYGQDGPLSAAAGHDINYVAMSGALEMFGNEPGGPPVFPVNVIGDFAGGAMMVVLGVALAAFERERSGRGQVVDAAMVEGAAAVLGPMFVAGSSTQWGPRGTNHLDGAAPFYNVYETADHRWISVGAIEPEFHAELYRRVGLDEPRQWDHAAWPANKEALATAFAARNRDEWCALMEGSNACFAPVLSPPEAAAHPHNVHRRLTTDVNGRAHPAPAPHLSRTPGSTRLPTHPGAFTIDQIRAEWLAGKD